MKRLHRLAVLLWATAAVGSGCTPGSGRLDAEALEAAFVSAAHAPRTFTLETDRAGRSLEIQGTVEDDYRYRAEVSVDGELYYEEVVIDDRRWLRPVSEAALGDGQIAPATASAVRALFDSAAGRWLADKAGAPPEFQPVDARARVLGPGAVLEAVRRLDALVTDPEELSRLLGAAPYDPDSANYLARNDRFDRHEANGERFDLVPLPYDTAAVFGDGVPPDLQEALRPFALYFSYWVREGRVTRMEILYDLDRDTVRRDLEATHEAVYAGTGTPAPPLPQVPPSYRETLTFSFPRVAPEVTAPEASEPVDLPEIQG